MYSCHKGIIALKKLAAHTKSANT